MAVEGKDPRPHPLGFDHNYVTQDPDKGLRLIAKVSHPSGRTLMVHTTEPAVQLYCAKWMPADGTPGKDGAVYPSHAGFCLETQAIPDSIGATEYEHGTCFILRPDGPTYEHEVLYQFGSKAFS